MDRLARITQQLAASADTGLASSPSSSSSSSSPPPPPPPPPPLAARRAYPYLYRTRRRPVKIVFVEENHTMQERYAGKADVIVLEGDLIVPHKRVGGGAAASPSGPPSSSLAPESRRCIAVFMHPMGMMTLLPLPRALARCGLHVICMSSRYPNNDSCLIMEKVALDMGAVVAHCRDALGYEKVVLMGWSGGASLSFFYQSQAERPTITHSPAGDIVDLTRAGLQPADAVLAIAAHVSRHATLTEFIDPAIADEKDPSRRIVDLDLYDARNPNKPPFAPAYVERFRQAQVARNRRITRWVKCRLHDKCVAQDGAAEQREWVDAESTQWRHYFSLGREVNELSFCVYGTMSDPRFMDLTLDKNGRPESNSCFLGRPLAANHSPIGLARYSTLRSWLSQWSYDDARAHGPACAARLRATTPVCVIQHDKDDACMPSHAREWMDAVTFTRKRLHTVAGATHYLLGDDQKPQLREVCRIILDFLLEEGIIIVP